MYHVINQEFCVKAQECAGLNGTQLVAAAFDPRHPLALHAVGDDGSALYLGLGNALNLIACKARFPTNPRQRVF